MIESAEAGIDTKHLKESYKVESVNHTRSKAQAHLLCLAESSSSIQGILTEIDGIAEQIKLLALNTTIEAARAGLSFAVVAAEVRNLANRTQSATELHHGLNIQNLTIADFHLKQRLWALLSIRSNQ